MIHKRFPALFISGLRAKARGFLDKSLSEGSKKSYDRFYNQYKMFCSEHKLKKFSTSSMELWVTNLAQEGKKHSAILSHVSAVKFFCVKKNSEVTFATHKLKLILRGIKNSQGRTQKKTQAISLDQLHTLITKAEQVLWSIDGRRFSAMVSCAFYGFLRPSEYCISSAGHHMSVGDVCFSKGAMEVHINSFKNSAESASIMIKAVGGKTCPFRLVKRYLKHLKPSRSSPLFEVTTAEFRKELSVVLKDSKIEGWVTPHSLRRGGATWASIQG
jgi:integrase